MAKVSIESATVIRIIEGYGFVVASEYRTAKGDTGKEYFTVWTKEKHPEGAVLAISGDLSVRLEEYTDREGKLKNKAVAHINNAKAKEVEAPF